MLPPAELGLVVDTIPGWNLVKGLGVGRFARVYAAARQEGHSDADPLSVLKFFRNFQVGMNEENILRRLAHLNLANIPVIQTSVQLMDGSFGLVVSPIGVPILPAPLGVRITPSMFITLLEVLESVHRIGIIHRDVKPENILLVGSNEIMLNDWGSAVEINLSCSYQGTPVYGEKNQGTHMPTRALDLCCLVKSAFTIKHQQFPPSDLSWEDIQAYWTSVSTEFPSFRSILKCAGDENYEGLKRFFSELW